VELFGESSLIKSIDCCWWWDDWLCVEGYLLIAFASATIYRGC